jgi:glycosyltransferase involved in cell wall biosynthesis
MSLRRGWLAPAEEIERARPAGSNGHHPIARPRPALSVIVPTRNESGNVRPLLDALEVVLPSGSEVVFVDDSDDDTREVIEAERGRRSLPIVLIHRAKPNRGDGLSGAVVRGLQIARAPWVCVMDADLQHPPAVIPDLLARAEAGDVDVVVASRYCENRSPNFGAGRALLSLASTNAARILFPRCLRRVTDPMSGFFLVRRSSVPVDRLRPRGFKILLEILVRARTLRVEEVPFEFGIRHSGESKASLAEGARYLRQLVALRASGNLERFLAVGATGLAVNTGAFALFANGAGLHYLLAAVLATQVSTTWNFALAERWVFGGRRRRVQSRSARFSAFLVLNNLSLLLRGPALYLLVSLIGMGSVLANLVSLLVIFAVRFAVADSLIWGGAADSDSELFWYRIHDQVTVESPVRLRELERFRVAEPIAEPTIRVRLGHLNRSQSDLVSALVGRITHTRYDEGLGRFGFAVDISWRETIDIVATPMLRYSPHVLYTNVVEPTLRWCFVTRGYALAHCACIAVDGYAYLITARTDTGKTTTILKLLDRYPVSFLSDDLTLIAPNGRVLMYPKPLTVSRHTVASVRTPLLTLRERLALVVQSRIHSRTGRLFAKLIARLRLPAATINAIVQLVIPPPKYDIDRLVPDVDIATEARISGFAVIERTSGEDRGLLPEEAVDILIENSEDAYGFPPYPALEQFLHSRNGRNLQAEERQILASALSSVPAIVLRSESMDWWQRVAALVGLAVADPEPEPVPAAAIEALPVPVE